MKSNIITSSLAVLTALFLSSCSSSSARIEGTFAGSAGKTVYLEQVMSSRNVIDSTTCSSNGQWSFKYKFTKKEPALLRVRMCNSFITLLVSPDEKVDISALQNIGNSYTVNGSPDSELVADLNRHIVSTHISLDSLYSLYNREDKPAIKSELYRKIAQKYIDHKRYAIRFLINNCHSLASIMALYTPMPNGSQVFGEKNDYRYYKMVADSLSPLYPTSVMVASLKKDVERFENRTNLAGKISASLAGESVSSPDLQMNDMFGTPHRLSDLRGKVVLLSFWSATTQGSTIMNGELKQVYDTFAKRGLEIYQISLDTDKSIWVGAVTAQKLPWISVCDFKGSASPAVGSYNVTSIPFNYILTQKGDIAGKNLWGEELCAKIEELL